MKILYITNLATRIGSFSYASIKASREHDIGFHIVANFSSASEKQIEEDQKTYGVFIHHADINRSPFSLANLRAYCRIVELIRKENIDYIHCNTPVGGILGRLAGKKCGVKKVIYQVHGLHFYKGAPKLNWLIYYPVEKWLSRYTDTLITINCEDYEFAKAHMKLRNKGKIHYVHGVGINLEPYQIENREELKKSKRNELGIKDDDFVLISVGRLDKNKNNKILIEAVSRCQIKNIHLLLCGDGEEREMLEQLAKELNIEKQIHFLGHRTDMTELYSVADAYVMASFREGLSRSIMEAMASGLPCLVSKIRGNIDLVKEKKGGYLYNPKDADGFKDGIKHLYNDSKLKEKMKEYNLEKIKEFDICVTKKEMEEIYSKTFN